jgi:heat-inducible transcriptional repressor
MLKLLDKMVDSDGVQVFIGSENILAEIKELSMVASTYNDGNRTLGTIGIIGPTRMNYAKIIPIVDMTARTLTQILSES